MTKLLRFGQARRCFALALVWVGIFLGLSSGVSAGGRFISAPSSMDMVYDDSLDILYIASGANVLRYSTASGTFLTPFALGGSLRGIDLSPDGSTLAVADLAYAGDSYSGTSWFHLVDIETEEDTKVTFSRGHGEGGTYSIAYGSDGKLLVTTTYLGSGWVPLRRYDPESGIFNSLLSSIRMDSMLSVSADRSVIAWEESNTSDGPFGRYRVSDGNIIHRTGYEYGTSAFNYSVGANRDGTQYAVLYGNAAICGADMIKTGTISGISSNGPGNVVYNPVEDVVYFSWTGTTKVRAYNTTTLSLVREYDMGGTFSRGAYGTGKLKTSKDGSLLFAIVPNGLSYVRLNNNAPVANAQAITTDEDMSASVTLTGSDPDDESITFSVVASPAHGNLTGTVPNLVYTPNNNYYGSDSFTFKATDFDTDSAAATVNVTVNPVDDAPTASAKSVVVAEEASVNIILTGSDPEGSALTYAVVGGPTHGTLSGTPPSVTYKPNFDYSGPDTFTYRVSDGELDSLPAAVSITVTPGLAHQTCSIGATRSLPAGTYVLIEDAVVTAANLEPGISFIASPGGFAGIKVLTNAMWHVGQWVSLKGYISRANGEYQLSNCTLGPTEDGEPVAPLFMMSRTIANDYWEDLNYTGINTAGMLVRLYGKVTAVIPSQRIVYINDGVSLPAVIGPFNGVRVQIPAGVALPIKGTRLLVTGVSRVSAQTVPTWTERNDGWYPPGCVVYVPVVAARNAGDLQNL